MVLSFDDLETIEAAVVDIFSIPLYVISIGTITGADDDDIVVRLAGIEDPDLNLAVTLSWESASVLLERS